MNFLLWDTLIYYVFNITFPFFQRAGIFNFCKEKLQSAIDLNISEIETMKAIIATKAFIQAKEVNITFHFFEIILQICMYVCKYLVVCFDIVFCLYFRIQNTLTQQIQ